MFTYDYKVRFGDISLGPYLHYSKFLDLTVQTMEEFSHVIDYPIEKLTSQGNIPFATVAAEGDITAYPKLVDTIHIMSEPVEISERTFTVHNRMERRSDGHEFGTTTTVHAVISPDGQALSLPQHVRESLSEHIAGAHHSTDSAGRINPSKDNLSNSEGMPGFEHTEAVWTPQLEAAGAVYYEDYFRLISAALEHYLADIGPTLKQRSTNHYPFKPTRWEMQFHAPTGYGERLVIRGQVMDSTDQELTINYSLNDESGSTNGLVKITYGCFDDGNNRVPFPNNSLIGFD